MVKFIRKIQELNRVAIPQEIMIELQWGLNDIVSIEIEVDKVIISKIISKKR